MPGFGKSGHSRMRAFRRSEAWETSTAGADTPLIVASERDRCFRTVKSDTSIFYAGEGSELLFERTNFRSTALISGLLVGMFAITGFCTSVYKHQRENLGKRHYAEGQRLGSSGNIEAAVEEYRRALIFAPDDTDYRISFVSALIGAGRFEEAESHIEQLLQEDPTNGS